MTPIEMKKITSLLLIAASLTACTNLEEQVLDETFQTNVAEKDIAPGLIAPVYALLPTIYQHTTYFALQQITTDEAILPYRGGTDWGDNGIYLELHRHTYNSNTANIRNTWNPLVQSLSRCVTAIQQLPLTNDPQKQVYLAEAIGMQAYYNLLLLDLYGLVFKKDDPGKTSEILRGNAAVEYLLQEFQKAEVNLPTRAQTQGRLSKPAVWGLMARLYLNAPVYRDRYASSFTFAETDMNQVITLCDRILNTGQYRLSPDYFSIFSDNNDTNPEIILAIDQRADLNGHNRLGYFSLSGDQFPLPAFPGANGTDGPAITSDFYRTWTQAYGNQDPSVDPRFGERNIPIPKNQSDTCIADVNFKFDRGILRGQQYGLIRVNGAFQRCANGQLRVGKLTNLTRNRPDRMVNFTERIDFSTEGSDYSTGYRVLKYEFSKSSNTGRNRGEHNIVLLRLADVHLMKAEALLRRNQTNEALSEVNRVRASRTAKGTPPPALTTLNLDLLFRERGFEFYWEMLRRTDMIRFTKYEGTWTEKSSTDRTKRIFPIPQTAIDGASNLPGYLTQNPGY